MPDIRLLPLANADRPAFPEMSNGDFAEMLHDAQSHTWQGLPFELFVIRQAGQTVGFVSLVCREKGVVSNGIGVSEPWRKQGIATEAMRQLLVIAHRLGYARMTTQIRTDNAASLALHRKLGFKLDETFINRRGREVHTMSLPLSGGTMHHEMSLRPTPFDMIAKGEKTYELRLNDEKRRLIRVGDTIAFTCTEDERRIQTRVTSLHPFDSFGDLYAELPLTCCGYIPENVADASPQDMEAYYSPEKQAESGVLAIGVERIRYPLQQAAEGFTLRELTVADVPEMLRIASSNPQFYQHMHTEPTAENLARDLTALPPRRTLADKHFFGWFDGKRLIAMMDLIARYPQEDMAFIGWFILDADCQRQGLGRRLVNAVIRMLAAQGVAEIRLGRVQDNPQSEGFWRAMGFAENGLLYETDGYTVIVMTKRITA